ncbi:undecaprenyl-diphosphatase [Kineococcus xinjiangensis]|uniref:Undecaprenyl-diphosphatase n=1 Tax=Kineococcus xinjiangensis TaxID=512762 RepID=A0A2S6IFY9_9ACTN|nr:phosphatase PAP2 family protein [Kineococcus xinjiangensis]PPK93129.1 undecaprenyl-diphosphatase [Kineococcus xinjiangensis]
MRREDSPRGRPTSTPDGPSRHPFDESLDDGRGHDFIGPWDLTHWPTAAGRRLADLAVRAGRRFAPHQVLAITVVLGLLLTAALTALASEVYEAVVEAEGVALLDRPVLNLAIALRSPELNSAVTAFTDVGGTVGMPILAATAAVGLSLLWRRWSPLVLVVVTMLGSLLLTVVGKAAVGRIRPPLSLAVPPLEQSASFPSGHTLNAVAFAGIVTYLVLRRARREWGRVLVVLLAAAFAVAMGLSRVYLGHHWLTDVLVAWALGLGWLSVVITAHRLFLTVHRRRRAAAGG